MDLQLLRSLLAVADTGAITQAADRIGLSQPALTRRLQQLEAHLGTPLLARGRKGVALTDAGRLVADEARLLIGRYDSLRQQLRAHARLDGGTVRVGGGATAVGFLLPDALAEFRARHPQVRFRLKEAGSREIAADVADGRLELGLVTLPVQSRELDVTPLLDDHIVPIARRGHPLAERRRVSAADFSGQTVVGFEAGSAIRQIIDGALRDAGVDVNVVMELRSIPTIIRMVATTGYPAFVSRVSLAGQREVVEIAVDGVAVQRRIAVVTRRGIPLSPAARVFVALLPQIVADAGAAVR